jgi:drug/metabolite transporter (DMT)-like permease
MARAAVRRGWREPPPTAGPTLLGVLIATVLALGSAGLHAAWNLLVKTSTNRDLAAWGQFLFGGLIVLPVLAAIGWPATEVLPYLLLSAVVHVVYVTGLVRAYDTGDFSLVYPVARGGGAFLAGIGGVALLGDRLGAWAWVAIAIVAGGLLSLMGRGASRHSIGWAAFTACTIATYTIIDAHGARAASDGVRYGLALMPLSALAISIVAVARRRTRAFVATLPTMWRRYLAAGAALTVAYTLVLVAVRSAPVGYVTMLRESSVVIGALAGWLLLKEQLGRSRVVSSAVVASGLVLLIAMR